MEGRVVTTTAVTDAAAITGDPPDWWATWAEDWHVDPRTAGGGFVVRSAAAVARYVRDLGYRPSEWMPTLVEAGALSGVALTVTRSMPRWQPGMSPSDQEPARSRAERRMAEALDQVIGAMPRGQEAR